LEEMVEEEGPDDVNDQVLPEDEVDAVERLRREALESTPTGLRVNDPQNPVDPVDPQDPQEGVSTKRKQAIRFALNRGKPQPRRNLNTRLGTVDSRVDARGEEITALTSHLEKMEQRSTTKAGGLAAYLQSLMVEIKDAELWRQYRKEVLAVTEHFLDMQRERDQHAQFQAPPPQAQQFPAPPPQQYQPQTPAQHFPAPPPQQYHPQTPAQFQGRHFQPSSTPGWWGGQFQAQAPCLYDQMPDRPGYQQQMHDQSLFTPGRISNDSFLEDIQQAPPPPVTEPVQACSSAETIPSTAPRTTSTAMRPTHADSH
ncbi:MAG: hypothetical protein GY873_34055, partial [Bosea sp.]|uniref:hypothetical protein n=1 Tax=Bosea sp. (in: a-proteobacteria) TaxID=1871050 RepID=UPI00239674A2|nr:hypothetical protein [Bosea sp. (in: a-proteobacteria)]